MSTKVNMKITLCRFGTKLVISDIEGFNANDYA